MKPATLHANHSAKIAILNEEMDAIHYANTLYWKQGTAQSKAAKSEYEFRQVRLEKIREELALLRGDDRQSAELGDSISR